MSREELTLARQGLETHKDVDSCSQNGTDFMAQSNWDLGRAVQPSLRAFKDSALKRVSRIHFKR